MSFSDSTVSVKKRAENISSVEEAEDDLSGTQFVCETVIRSLTLDAAPDHKPPCRQKSTHSECPRIPHPPTPQNWGGAWLVIARPEQIEVLFFTESGGESGIFVRIRIMVVSLGSAYATWPFYL